MNSLTQIKQNRNIFFMIAVVAIIAVVGVSVWFLRQQTNTNQRAAASTTVAFTAPSGTISSGQQISSDLTVDPGTNQVSVVNLVLTYDSTQIEIASASSLSVNATAFPQTLAEPATSCNGTQCTMTATYSVGSNPTNAITTKTKLATFIATVVASSGTTVTVGFDATTSVYSIAATDQASENVLSSTVPLSFTVNGGSTPTPTSASSGITPTPTEAGLCNMNTATCEWDTLSNTTSYHYKITDETTGNTIKEGDLSSSQTSVEFPQQPGDKYTCSVTATNACKTDSAATVSNICPALTSTPTPSLSPTLTPTSTLTPTPTVTPLPTATPPPAKLTCNGGCTSDAQCGSGLACISGFCRNPACSTNYSCSCTVTTAPAPTNPPQSFVPTSAPQYIASVPTYTPVPTQAPKMLPTGPGDTFIKVGAIGAALTVIGGIILFIL